MALPNKADLVTLDYELGGMPFVVTETSAGAATQGLDIEWGGLAFASSPSDASASTAYVTQAVYETLRDGDDPGGGNARLTHIVREALVAQTDQAYLTAITIERLTTYSPVAGVGTSWMVFDRVNTFDVWLPQGTLSSAASDVDVLNGANLCLLGSEVLQFRDVTSLGSGVYRLSYLLRGRFGTEWAMTEHGTSEKFVLLTNSTILRQHGDAADLNRVVLYKAVSSGLAVDAVVPELLYNTGVGLKPYAGCHITGARDGSNNLTITWFRRTRVTGGWSDAVDVPVGETTESYEVDILTSAGAVIRTIATTTPTASYTAAQQTTDFGAVQNPVVCMIYQLSSIVGRGYGARGVV